MGTTYLVTMETEKKGRSALNNADLEEGEATS